jgi:hypothetical protein
MREATSDTGVTTVVDPSDAGISHQEIPLEGEPYTFVDYGHWKRVM